ncbi:MAG: HigA family addiction module antitoxin [Spirochaetota bacterium]|nr:HigA family addiction module antitoxin [Spirochaetota bacterium]
MANQFFPDYAIHPGEYIEEILEARDMKKHDFAERSGVSVKTISQILNKKSLFSSDLALMFEKVLGVSADILMNLSTYYQMYESRNKEKEEIELKSNWVKQFPQKELISHDIIPDTKDTHEKANALLDFFNVSTPEVWEKYYNKKAVSFRKSPTYNSSLICTATWLRIGERLASEVECDCFNKDIFKNNLDSIRDITVESPDVFEPKMKELCAKSGVALVFVPELKDTHISGATEWISSDKALIVISLRYKSDDHFWFIFFHEAAHILLHNKKDIFIDNKDDKYSELEEEANYFARKILINQTAYRNFIKRKKIDKDDIERFAFQNRIAPGILVEMMQHDQIIEYSWHNDLKRKFELANRNAAT